MRTLHSRIWQWSLNAAVVVASAERAIAQTEFPPAPPSNLRAADHPWDGGDQIDLEWDLSPDDASLSGYKILEAVATVGGHSVPIEFEVVRTVRPGTKAYTASDLDGALDHWDVRKRYGAPGGVLDVDALVAAGEDEFPIGYLFQVVAVSKADAESAPTSTAEPLVPVIQLIQPFDGGRLWVGIVTLIICGSIVTFIVLARSGMKLHVRKIAGLAAVDEAVGRATEMGRPVLFVAGTQDMNDMQTVAGLTVLSRVAKTAAEYDAKVEVPTSRSLVMTAARETVHASFLAAGRPDSYNEDLIYYVTDEQFGFVAYLQGMMVREKPAACFYLGHFFAESLILAETGNSIGAIQVAGTAAPAQLPFFVAACDYTLIGEEFFAASAYLSGEPDQLGSLKGQDVGKLIVAMFLIFGCILYTAAVVWKVQSFYNIVDFIRGTMLT
jgi:hypothetical protein